LPEELRQVVAEDWAALFRRIAAFEFRPAYYRCAEKNDLGRFKTPTLRALSARAPYFHNGIASTLEDVVRHYETHLGFVFTSEERADLVAFLKAL
jgi:cytochrome c peroxidase